MASSLSRSDSDALIRLCVAGLTCRRADGQGCDVTAVCLSDHSGGRGKKASYLQDVVGGLQVEEGRCGCVLVLLPERKETLSIVDPLQSGTFSPLFKASCQEVRPSRQQSDQNLEKRSEPKK